MSLVPNLSRHILTLSRPTNQDSAAFEKAAKTKDFSSTMKAFQAFFVDGCG